MFLIVTADQNIVLIGSLSEKVTVRNDRNHLAWCVLGAAIEQAGPISYQRANNILFIFESRLIMSIGHTYYPQGKLTPRSFGIEYSFLREAVNQGNDETFSAIFEVNNETISISDEGIELLHSDDYEHKHAVSGMLSELTLEAVTTVLPPILMHDDSTISFEINHLALRHLDIDTDYDYVTMAKKIGMSDDMIEQLKEDMSIQEFWDQFL